MAACPQSRLASEHVSDVAPARYLEGDDLLHAGREPVEGFERIDGLMYDEQLGVLRLGAHVDAVLDVLVPYGRKAPLDLGIGFLAGDAVGILELVYV